MCRAFCLVLLASCVVDTDIDKTASIACEDGVCPRGWSCHATLLRCVKDDTTLLSPSVVFSAPGRDEVSVSVTPTIVVAFNLPIDTDGVGELLHLEDEAIDVISTGEASTVAIKPRAPLLPLHRYTLTIDAGVMPRPGLLAEASAEPDAIAFTTGEAPDRTPPAPVTNVEVDHLSAATVDLRWTNPSDGDFAGVLIVRKANAHLNGAPTAAVSYAALASIGDGEVLTVTKADHFRDVTAPPGASSYTLFAMDTSANYAAGVSPPLVTDVTLRWCPNETGSFTATSPDTGDEWLIVDDGTSSASSMQSPLGTVATFASGGVFALGQTYSVRLAARSTGGFYYAPPRTFITSRAALTPLTQPLAVSLGGTAIFGFTPYGWPAFQAEVDTEPAVGADSFTSAAMLTSNQAKSTFLSAGTFRFRVRPVVSDCADAAWVTSSEFLAGSGVLYVSANGPGGNGLDPQHPFVTIGQALAAATGGTDVRVATGTYNERVNLKPGVRLYGGFSSDFTSRDEAPLDPGFGAVMPMFETIIAPSGNSGSTDNIAVRGVGSSLQATTVIDGFTIVQRPTAAVDSRSVSLESGASPLVSNNRIHGGAQASGSFSYAVFLDVGSQAQIVGNDIMAEGGAQQRPVGVAINGCATGAPCRALVADNHILGHYGIRVQGSAGTYLVQGISHPALEPTIRHNYIEADEDTPFADRPGPILCAVNAQILVDRNVIIGRPAFLNLALGANAIQLQNCSMVADGNSVHMATNSAGWQIAIQWGGAAANGLNVLRNNVIDNGATSSNYAMAIQTDISGLWITNNLIYAGRGTNTNRGCIRLEGGSTPKDAVIVNNILLGDTPWKGIEEANHGPIAVQNNLFLAPAPDYYAQPFGQLPRTSIASLESYYCGVGTRATGNVATSLKAEDLYNVTRVSGELQTSMKTSWRSNDATLAMGIDASQPLCGTVAAGMCSGSGSGDCEGTLADRDGLDRQAPFRAGPYR